MKARFFKVKSFTTPGKEYQVVQDIYGVWHCTCPKFVFSKDGKCKHIIEKIKEIEWGLKWRIKNRDRIRANNKAYYEKNKIEVRKRQKAYSLTPKGKEAINRAHQKRVLKDREKVSARYKIYDEVRHGRIKKQPCEVCNDPNTERHHEDYSQPLKIRWLCHKHHMEADKKMAAIKANPAEEIKYT